MIHWAEQYIGKPWVNGACGPDAYDCHGIVRAVYLEQLGIELPVVNVDALSTLDACRSIRDYDHSDWVEIPAPEFDLDVVEMSRSTRPHHVGVFVDGGVLTSVESAGVVWQSMASLKRYGWNIVSCYRRRT